MDDLKDPWLVAAWPGMGGGALIAGTYLAQDLGAEKVAELPPRSYFDLDKIQISRGIARPGALPKSSLYAWKDPRGRRDLLIFLGDAQPSNNGYSFCEELLTKARELGARRMFTFAAMATPASPQQRPRVFGVATEPDLLDEVIAQEDTEVLAEGEISGLNGVLLAAGAAGGLPGVCLLGEFPYFASGVPNPKASAAVLRVFCGLAGLEDVDFSKIDAQAQAVEHSLTDLLEQLQQKAQAAGEQGEFPTAFAPVEEEEEDDDEAHEPEQLDAQAEARIEQLFVDAARDRAKALELKAELDRLDVFKRYEDRFLDLFKRAE